jgi:hypothetical protein
MLKRRRASSPPPPSQYEEESIAGPSTDVPKIPGPKRRRTVAPVLSGEYRGWGGQSIETETEDDWAEEDDFSEDETPTQPEEKRHHTAEQAGGIDYTAANSLLHDLHWRHQQQRNNQSVSGLPLHSPSLSLPTTPAEPHRSVTPHLYGHPGYAQDGGLTGKFMPNSHAWDAQPRPAILHPHGTAQTAPSTEDGTVVMHQYENVNKYVFVLSQGTNIYKCPCRLLGSLVLHRRRELHKRESLLGANMTNQV